MRALGLDVPHPVGDSCPWKETHSWHIVNEAAQRHGRKGLRYWEVPGKAGEVTDSLCSHLVRIVTEH